MSNPPPDPQFDGVAEVIVAVICAALVFVAVLSLGRAFAPMIR